MPTKKLMVCDLCGRKGTRRASHHAELRSRQQSARGRAGTRHHLPALWRKLPDSSYASRVGKHQAPSSRTGRHTPRRRCQLPLTREGDLTFRMDLISYDCPLESVILITTDEQMQTTLEHIARFQHQVMHLRKTRNYRAAISGFLSEIDRMQLEVREYLSFLPTENGKAA